MHLIIWLFVSISYAQDFTDAPWGVRPYSGEIGEEKNFWKTFRAYSPVAKAFLMGNFDNAGISPRALFQPNFPAWNQIHKNIEEDLKMGSCPTTDCDGTYDRDLALVSDGRNAYAQEVKFLANGKSFDLRKRLISQAKKTIYIAVWAIYNDETGDEFGITLMTALKKNPKLDIKIIVDGNIATMPGHWETLEKLVKLSKGKIKVIYWKSWKYRANGNHRKLFVVDNEHVIMGGLNIGNKYSHRRIDKPEDAWRDFDVYLRGRSVGIQAHNQFTRIWRKQIDENEMYKHLEYTAPLEHDRSNEGMPVVLVDQDPGTASHKSTHSIHTAVVKLFRNAKERIDIENAYFIMDPIIRDELKAVLKRGIEVRIFTNSDESVDEPVVTLPIVSSAQQAALMGAKVYLKRGATLHSKFMVVDRKISFVGSFNFHPRSLKLDGENVAVIFDEDFADELGRVFEEGIQEAHFVANPDLLFVNFHLLSFLTKNLCYDCL